MTAAPTKSTRIVRVEREMKFESVGTQIFFLRVPEGVSNDDIGNELDDAWLETNGLTELECGARVELFTNFSDDDIEEALEISRLDQTIGQAQSDITANRDVVLRAGDLVAQNREEIASIAAAEFNKVAEQVELDLSLIAGATGVAQPQLELYLAKVRMDPTLGSKLLITDAMRAQLKAAQAGTVAANEASDLQSRTRLDLEGASVENGGGRISWVVTDGKATTRTARGSAQATIAFPRIA